MEYKDSQPASNIEITVITMMLMCERCEDRLVKTDDRLLENHTGNW